MGSSLAQPAGHPEPLRMYRQQLPFPGNAAQAGQIHISPQRCQCQGRHASVPSIVLALADICIPSNWTTLFIYRRLTPWPELFAVHSTETIWPGTRVGEHKHALWGKEADSPPSDQVSKRAWLSHPTPTPQAAFIRVRGSARLRTDACSNLFARRGA